MSIFEGAINYWLAMGEAANAPTTYRVPLAPELARSLEVFAAVQNVTPEAIIAEAVRAYLGVDA